jgi:hypothetical protein
MVEYSNQSLFTSKASLSAETSVSIGYSQYDVQWRRRLIRCITPVQFSDTSVSRIGDVT